MWFRLSLQASTDWNRHFLAFLFSFNSLILFFEFQVGLTEGRTNTFWLFTVCQSLSKYFVSCSPYYNPVKEIITRTTLHKWGSCFAEGYTVSKWQNRSIYCISQVKGHAVSPRSDVRIPDIGFELHWSSALPLTINKAAFSTFLHFTLLEAILEPRSLCSL